MGFEYDCADCCGVQCNACIDNKNPSAWTVPLAGFGDGSFQSSLLNGTWTAPFTSQGSSACTWDYNPGAGAGQTVPIIIIIGESPTNSPNWFLTVGVIKNQSNVLLFSAQYQYTSAGTPKDCTAPMTFSNPVLQPSAGDAAPYAHPATITITPVP